jgi:hypothetical protein
MEHPSMLRFAEEAQRTFEFLKEYGFSCVSVSPNKVRFESKKVFIEVSHGARDGEVAITFGRLHKNEEFSFTLFLRLIDAAFEAALGERLAHNADEVRTCLITLAKALRTRGESIICGEDSVFERMKHVRWWDFQPDALKET